jgi:hypothetical protein
MIFTRLDSLYIVIPMLAVFALFKWWRRKSYLTLSMFPYIGNRIRPVSRFVYLPRVLELLALLALGIALLNPVQPSAERTIVNKGLDILLVLDLSWSMQEPIDLEGALQRRRAGITQKEPTRLEAVKETMLRFVQKRHGDRIGLVVFSENAYVVAPMTQDMAYLTNYLRMVDNKTLSSEGQTAIGEGILTALNLVEQQKQGSGKSLSKVMIVHRRRGQASGGDSAPDRSRAIRGWKLLRRQGRRATRQGVCGDRSIGKGHLLDQSPGGARSPLSPICPGVSDSSRRRRWPAGDALFHRGFLERTIDHRLPQGYVKVAQV